MPFDKLTVCYWKWPFIVVLPCFTYWTLWFSIVMLVYHVISIFWMVKNMVKSMSNPSMLPYFPPLPQAAKRPHRPRAWSGGSRPQMPGFCWFFIGFSSQEMGQKSMVPLENDGKCRFTKGTTLMQTIYSSLYLSTAITKVISNYDMVHKANGSVFVVPHQNCHTTTCPTHPQYYSAFHPLVWQTCKNKGS